MGGEPEEKLVPDAGPCGFSENVFFLLTLRFAPMCSKQKELQNQESLALSCKLLKLSLLTSQEFVFIVCVCMSRVHLLCVCVCRVNVPCALDPQIWTISLDTTAH